MMSENSTIIWQRPFNHLKTLKYTCTHLTLDNNDGKQDPLSGAGTTHDTNSTIFQPLPPVKTRDNEANESGNSVHLTHEIGIQPEIFSKKTPSLIFPEYRDDTSRNLLDGRLHKDIAWALSSSTVICDELHETSSLGSWTAVSKKVTQNITIKSNMEYLYQTSQTFMFVKNLWTLRSTY